MRQNNLRGKYFMLRIDKEALINGTATFVTERCLFGARFVFDFYNALKVQGHEDKIFLRGSVP